MKDEHIVVTIKQNRRLPATIIREELGMVCSTDINSLWNCIEDASKN